MRNDWQAKEREMVLGNKRGKAKRKRVEKKVLEIDRASISLLTNFF